MGTCCSAASPTGQSPAPEHEHEQERKNELISQFAPTAVQILRRRFVEAKGNARYLDREAFRSVFEVQDMPKVCNNASTAWRSGVTGDNGKTVATCR